MALEAFMRILANNGVIVHKPNKQRFSDLEVEESGHQTAVCWKAMTGSKASSVKMPDTATLGECSVFAVEADTKEKFKKQAEEFLGDNMGSKTLKKSMALVVHYDGDGKPQSAIVGYPLVKGPLICYGSLKVETANKIAMKLNRGKGPGYWHLEEPRKGPSKKTKLSGTGGKVSAKNESNSASD